MRASQLLANVCIVLSLTSTLAGDDFFEARVRPLLIEHCHECHQRQAEGGLRLDSRESMIQGGSSGPAIVPGNSARSLLVRAVKRENEETAMPPDESLTEEEIQILVKWI